MDRLDEILEVASPLLARVDGVLEAGGAPPGHRLWGELRRVRLLPADACRAVAALRPPAFADAVPDLRAAARACAETAADLPPPGEWSGEAAEAYDDHRRRSATRLSDGADSLDERLEATADLAAALADWMSRTRAHLAVALATVLASDEALVLTTTASRSAATPGTRPGTAQDGAVTTLDPPMTADCGGDAILPTDPPWPAAAPTLTQLRAAADIGERILRVIADDYADADDLLHGSASLTEAVPM